MNKNQKPILIYVGDPMCSWCYGIAPELDKVEEHFTDQLDYQIILGGLRPYNKETMADLKDFLKGHWLHVQEASGQLFNYGILDSTSITYDTEPPCRAVVAVRDLDASKTSNFFHDVQKAFYAENKNMHLTASYFDALEKSNIDRDKFIQLFESEELKVKVRDDFEKSTQMNVRGFPTLLLKHGDNLTIITNGYAKSEVMIQKIRELLK